MSSFGSLLGYFWIFSDVCFSCFFDNLLEGTFSILSAKLASQSTLLEIILETFWCLGGNVKMVVSLGF